MPRTIVQIHSDGLDDKVMLRRPLGVFPNDFIESTLKLSNADPDIQSFRSGALVPSLVKTVGIKLAQQLAANAAVSQAMQAAEAQAAVVAGHSVVICFDIRSPSADELPWEALFANRFFALTPQLPSVARVADSNLGSALRERVFAPPLKILLVLAAAQIQAKPEWDGLLAAFQATPLDLDICVLVAERDLFDEIKKAGPPARCAIRPSLLSDRETLERELRAGPQIVHFFCHGSVDPSPHLRLATPVDWFAGPGSETIAIQPSDLRQVPGFVDASWLTTLNACESAMASRDVRPFARQLVVEGFSAVIGMRESVDAAIANTFGGSLYREILSIVNQALPAAGNTGELEWSRALCQPRQRVCELKLKGQIDAAETCKEWTIPILYVSAEPLTIRSQVANPLSAAERQVLLARLRVMRETRDVIRGQPDTPPALLARFDELINQLEEQLFKV